MIQATNSHIRRLFNEKMQAEDELQECKERVKNNIQNVINQRELCFLWPLQLTNGLSPAL